MLKSMIWKKVSSLIIYLLAFVICTVIAVIDLRAGKTSTSVIAADVLLAATWMAISIHALVDYIKCRKAFLYPYSVRLSTGTIDITVVDCPSLHRLVDILAHNADKLSSQKLAMAIELYDPDKERVEYEHHPIKDYLADQNTTVQQDSQN